MSRLKKSATVVFIIILLMQSGGLLFFYRMQQLYVQEKMKERLLNDADEDVERKTLSVIEYNKARINEHEIVLNGKMYDVKLLAVHDDKVELLMIADEHEDRIIHEIKKEISKKSSRGGEQPDGLVKLLAMTYLAPSHTYDFVCAGNTSGGFPLFSEAVSLQPPDRFSPPPEWV